MVAISNIILLAATATASVLRRDAATIQADLKTINSDVQALTSKTNAYNGGVSNAIPIQNAYSTLDNDIQSATTDANNSAAVSATDAQSIIDYINNTLEPNIKTSITALKNKKSQFAADGLTGTVQSDLKNIKTDTDSLGSALISKTPSSKTSAANSAQAKIDADLQDGINYFSS